MTIHDYTYQIVDAIMKAAQVDPIYKYKISRNIGKLDVYKNFKHRKITERKITAPKRPRTRVPFNTLPIHIQKIILLACEKHDMDIETFCSDSRKTDKIEAQRNVMYFLHREVGYTSTKVAKFFMKDHSTVLHACNAHNDIYETSSMYAKIYDIFKEEAMKVIAEV